MSSKSIYRICNSNIIVHLHFIVPWPLPIPDPAGSRSILHYGCWGRKLIGNTIHLDMRGWPICCWFKGNYASAWWKHYSSSIVLDSLRTAHIRIVRTVVSFVSLCPSQIPARKSSLTNCWTFISVETCTCLMDWPTMVAVYQQHQEYITLPYALVSSWFCHIFRRRSEGYIRDSLYYVVVVEEV
jgi:hypothetical protein